jgi:hypothetical protein
MNISKTLYTKTYTEVMREDHEQKYIRFIWNQWELKCVRATYVLYNPNKTKNNGNLEWKRNR